MQIQTKFKSGDAVCRIENFANYSSTGMPCPACHGKGQLIYMKDQSLLCRAVFKGNFARYECVGGILQKCIHKWRVNPYGYRIERVEIEEEDGDVDISYLLDDDYSYSENVIFATDEEAQAECDLRNKKMEMDNK